MHPWDWHIEKSDRTLAQRGFDFEFVTAMFDGPVVVRRSDRDGEPRVQAVGMIGDLYFSVVYTNRYSPRHRRIISARRATHHEIAWYHSKRRG